MKSRPSKSSKSVHDSMRVPSTALRDSASDLFRTKRYYLRLSTASNSASAEIGRRYACAAPHPWKFIIHGYKLHTKLSKGLSSLLVRMRTGKIGLRKYLHNRKVPDVDNPMCQCGQAPQSVTHVLIHCSMIRQFRRETWKEEEKNHAWKTHPC